MNMDKAASSLRRSGAFLWSFGTGHQELSLIISDIKILKSQVKAIRDSQQTILHDIVNWTCVEENRALQELFLHLSDLNSIWTEVQTQFAEQISEFRHQFEMILEGEKNVDAVKNKLASCEDSEEKAVKKLKKAQKKTPLNDIRAVESKVEEIKSQKELTQKEVTEKVRENEAVKLIRVKDGLLKFTEAYLALSHKCIYVFEAQRDILKSLPDIEDKEIQEIRFDGLSGAKDILQRARTFVKDYSVIQRSSQQRTTDPPPPYSPNPLYLNTPFNPYYPSPAQTPDSSQPRNDAHGGLYPAVRPDEELAGAMSAAKI